MEFTRLRTCLDDEFRLLRSVITGTDPKAPVPSCPDWNVTDLAGHVTEVYLHKTECIRHGAEPEPWPPETFGPDPLAALDEAYAALTAEFDAHDPGDHAGSWYASGESVGFWIRRMAQETAIHRVDAELAAGLPVTPIAEDLAVDGVDEILVVFIAYTSVAWLEYFAELLDTPDEHPVFLATGDHTWSARATKQGVMVAEVPAGTTPRGPGATVRGSAHDLLLWLWNRAGDEAVCLDGDPELLAQFRGLRVIATQ